MIDVNRQHLVTVLGILATDFSFPVPALPASGETVMGSGSFEGLGGKGSNQAIAAARAGCDAVFITKLGEGRSSSYAQAVWRRSGVSPRIIVGPGIENAYSIVTVEESGRSTVIISPGAANSITVQEISVFENEISSSSVFMTQLELPAIVIEASLSIARKGLCKTILNLSPVLSSHLTGELISVSVLADVDILTATKTEAQRFLRIQGADEAKSPDPFRIGQAFLTRGVRQAVILLEGQENFNLVTRDGNTPCSLSGVYGVTVDKTGLLDAFNGNFAAAVAYELSLSDAFYFGVYAACVAQTRFGAANSMPDLNEISLAASMLMSEGREQKLFLDSVNKMLHLAGIEHINNVESAKFTQTEEESHFSEIAIYNKSMNYDFQNALGEIFKRHGLDDIEAANLIRDTARRYRHYIMRRLPRWEERFHDEKTRKMKAPVFFKEFYEGYVDFQAVVKSELREADPELMSALEAYCDNRVRFKNGEMGLAAGISFVIEPSTPLDPRRANLRRVASRRLKAADRQ